MKEKDKTSQVIYFKPQEVSEKSRRKEERELKPTGQGEGEMARNKSNPLPDSSHTFPEYHVTGGGNEGQQRISWRRGWLPRHQVRDSSVSSEPASPQTTKMSAEASLLGPAKPRTIQKPKPKKFFSLVVFILLFAAFAVSYLAYKSFKKENGLSMSEINFTIQAEEKAVSGGETEYKIILENKEDFKLQNVELNVRLPSNFYVLAITDNRDGAGVSTSSDAEESKEKEPLADVKAKDELVILKREKASPLRLQYQEVGPKSQTLVSLKGLIFGKVGEKKTITADLYYEPEIFTSGFQESRSFTSEITKSLISLEIKGPEKALVGKEVEYMIVVSKEGVKTTFGSEASESEKGLEFAQLKIFAELPQDFELKTVVPEFSPEDEQEFWLIESLGEFKSNEVSGISQKEFKIKGSLGGRSGEYQALKIRLGFLIFDKVGALEPVSEFLLQQEESFLTLLVEPKFDLILEEGGFSLASQAVDWGEELVFGLSYKNAGDLSLSDVVLKLDFTEDDILDWNSLDCESPSPEQSCELVLSPGSLVKGLSWREEQLAGLKSIKTGESGKVVFKVNIISRESAEGSTPPQFKNRKNIELLSQAKAQAKVEDFGEQVFLSNAVSLKIRTKLDLEAEARYFTDEYLKIGAGPLPPKVGEATTYRIFWYLKNTVNSVKDLKVETILPQGVSWPNETQTTLGEISYNESTGEVIWSVPELGAYAGGSSDPTEVMANFEITIVPIKSQAGQYLVLTQDTFAAGKDSWTGEETGDHAGYLTSELPDDLGAAGKGLVVE